MSELNFAAQIEEVLKEQHKLAVEALNKAGEKAAKSAVKTLKATSPEKTGDYGKSWTQKAESGLSGIVSRTVYSKSPHYRLTHLLEFGHAKVGGGRVAGIPHIKPAEEAAIKEFMDGVKEVLERG